MLSKGIMQQDRSETKQFKSATGSPVTYARLRKQKGMYYPMARPHMITKNHHRISHHHICVVYSKMYGREVYENIDIWPDNLDLMKDKHAVVRLYENLSDIPDTLEDSDLEQEQSDGENKSSEDITVIEEKKPSGDEKKHVTIKITDASDDETQSSVVDPTDLDHPDSPSDQSGEWPVKRSQSVDSRDNPFLPGGNLSKEAEDILSRATIIRDTFILKDDQRIYVSQGSPDAEQTDQTDHCNAKDDVPVTEAMTSTVIKNTEAAVTPNSDTRPKENGQLDTENSLTPGSVKVDIIDDMKDKKKQKKCCTIM